MKEIDKQILQNMHTHYSGLLRVGAESFGEDFMSESIFNSCDTTPDKKLSEQEVLDAKSNLDTYIKQAVEQDSFYAELYFNKSYTKGMEKVDLSSDKTPSEQIIKNNLDIAVNMIRDYVNNNPDDTEVKKYLDKLDDIISKGNLRLTNIDREGVAGRAEKLNNEDVILIDNTDVISNLNPAYLLHALLHELRHTMEADNINSKAEELEAEVSARDLSSRINPEPQFFGDISNFVRGYVGYAEASPGTYDIPQNTGIAVWYKPEEVKFEDNKLVIKSGQQASINGGHIEDHVEFGDETDENGNAFPVSATRIVYDSEGEVIFTADYGKYDKEKRSFDYFNVKVQQTKFEFENFGNKKVGGFGLT